MCSSTRSAATARSSTSTSTRRSRPSRRRSPAGPRGEGQGARAAARPDLLQRRFRRSVQPESARNLASFVRHRPARPGQAGATINITYHTAANARFNARSIHERRSRIVLEKPREGSTGSTNVRWVTIAERGRTRPNVTLAAVRGAVPRARRRARHPGPSRPDPASWAGTSSSTQQRADPGPHPLVDVHRRPHERSLRRVLGARLLGLLGHCRGMEYRLKQHSRDRRPRPLLAGARKPSYVTEFGVRGIQSFPGKPNDRVRLLGRRHADIARTNIAAFQQLWFDLRGGSARLQRARSSGTLTGAATTPRYRELVLPDRPRLRGLAALPRLPRARTCCFQTTARGWQVLQVEPWD